MIYKFDKDSATAHRHVWSKPLHDVVLTDGHVAYADATRTVVALAPLITVVTEGIEGVEWAAGWGAGCPMPTIDDVKHAFVEIVMAVTAAREAGAWREWL
jgi:hypothetical protein